MFEDGSTITDLSKINQYLEQINVTLSFWDIGNDAELEGLLSKSSLSDSEKEIVLVKLDHYFEKLKNELGYQSRDLIVIHDGIPNLDEMLAKFTPCHTHDDDEVRYIIDGEGVFGFVMPDNSQVELTVEAREFINVPKNAEHWFHLSEKRRTKAVRYFSGMDGWVPNYTNTKVRF